MEEEPVGTTREWILDGRARALAGLVTVALAAAACGGGTAASPAATGSVPTASPSTTSTTGPDASGEPIKLEPPVISVTHPVYGLFLPGAVGPFEYGEGFGVDYQDEQYVVLDSHAVATQAVLSGRADVVAGSTSSHLGLISQGQPFRIFGVVHAGHDLVLAVNNSVDSIDDLFSGNARLGVDSPGGSGYLALIAMLRASGETRSVADMANVVVLESSGQRATALGSNNLDAAIINSSQLAELQAALPDEIKALVQLLDVAPGYHASTLLTSEENLQNNRPALAALLASIIQASREMKEDYNSYLGYTREYLSGGGPNEGVVRASWDTIRGESVWPDDGGLSDAGIQSMIDLAKEAGLIEGDLTPAEAVDRGPLEDALELLGD